MNHTFNTCGFTEPFCFRKKAPHFQCCKRIVFLTFSTNPPNKDPKGGEIRHRHQAVTGESEVEAPLLQIRTSVVLGKMLRLTPRKTGFSLSFCFFFWGGGGGKKGKPLSIGEGLGRTFGWFLSFEDFFLDLSAIYDRGNFGGLHLVFYWQ